MHAGRLWTGGYRGNVFIDIVGQVERIVRVAAASSNTRCAPSSSARRLLASQGPNMLRNVPVFVSHTTIDCHDAYALSEWWREALSYEMDPDDPDEPGDEECLIHDPESGHTLLFIEVPDTELPAKRIHFDVRPRERAQDDEVVWLESKGAQRVADHRGIYGPGSGWVTLCDPEGNQFCVLSSVAEVARQDR